MAHVRVAGGEMTSKLYEFRDLIAEDALTFCSRMRRWSVEVPGCVGLMAQEHNLVFTPYAWTSGVGVVANAHLTAGIADAPFLEFHYDSPEWDVDLAIT